jgi:hypothetical protein
MGVKGIIFLLVLKKNIQKLLKAYFLSFKAHF